MLEDALWGNNKYDVLVLPKVLILIMLEDALWVQWLIHLHKNNTKVLILIMLEDALWEV